MPTLGDAERARDEAMDRVQRNTNPEWDRFMRRIIIALARRYSHISMNNIWDVYYTFEIVPFIHDKRAAGPIMRDLQTQGVFAATGVNEPSRRRHTAPLNVWRSLICPEGAPPAPISAAKRHRRKKQQLLLPAPKPFEGFAP